MSLFKRRPEANSNQSVRPTSDSDAWGHVGAKVVHSTFGTGEVVEVGSYKGTEAVWIAFDQGMVKMLDAEVATTFLRMRDEGAADSRRPQGEVRCVRSEAGGPSR